MEELAFILLALFVDRYSGDAQAEVVEGPGFGGLLDVRRAAISSGVVPSAAVDEATGRNSPRRGIIAPFPDITVHIV